MELDGIFKFLKLTHDFQKVERVIFVNGLDRKENDVEHSYQLAMLGWYITSTQKLNLNIDLVIKYGMLHDLVEVYAGDTYLFDKDPTVHESKVQREAEALEKLKIEFSEFPEMTETISAYEKRDDEESQFIYALDKIIPPLNIYLDEGRTWKKHDISFKQLFDSKVEKVAAHPEVEKFFHQLVELLKADLPKLFPREK